MPRIATVRLVLALLGVVILLANPAGICAGTVGSAKSAAHPCCPKPSVEKAPCICIDRQDAAPTLPPLADQTDLQLEAAAAPVLDPAPAANAEPIDDPGVAHSPDTILLSIHQLLL